MWVELEDDNDQSDICDTRQEDQDTREDHAGDEYGQDEEIELGQVATVQHRPYGKEADDRPVSKRDEAKRAQCRASGTIEDNHQEAAYRENPHRHPDPERSKCEGNEDRDPYNHQYQKSTDEARAPVSFHCL